MAQSQLSFPTNLQFNWTLTLAKIASVTEHLGFFAFLNNIIVIPLLKKGEKLVDMIDNILQALGITKLYSGYHLIKRAVSLALEDDTRLIKFRDRIYMELAKQEGVSWKNIERNMRTAVKRAWEINPDYIEKLAGRDLDKQPSVSEFVTYIAGAVEAGA